MCIRDRFHSYFTDPSLIPEDSQQTYELDLLIYREKEWDENIEDQRYKESCDKLKKAAFITEKIEVAKD